MSLVNAIEDPDDNDVGIAHKQILPHLVRSRKDSDGFGLISFIL
jgi:hypothetical protein